MLPRMIYLNGPPGSGKTALADALCSAVPNVTQVQFPMPLWEIADGILHQMGVLRDSDEPLDFASQTIKNSPAPADSPGLTWRGFLVEQADLLRKYYGPTILGRICAETSKGLFLQGFDTIIFPNVRTAEDLIALMPLAPKREQVLIQLAREGTTWEGDNGYYIDPIPMITTARLSNNGTIAELLTAVLNFVEETPINEPA